MLKSLIADGVTVLALSPEELALAVLKNLNASDESYARRQQRENISLNNYCWGQAQSYNDVSHEECARAIAAAFQHLLTIGMVAPNPNNPSVGSYTLTARAKTVKNPADYERYRHASSYPRGVIHPTIDQNTYSEFMKGDYESAVFKALKTLEGTVRTRAGLGNESIGVNLMRQAFHPDHGPLRDESELWAEREFTDAPNGRRDRPV